MSQAFGDEPAIPPRTILIWKSNGFTGVRVKARGEPGGLKQEPREQGVDGGLARGGEEAGEVDRLVAQIGLEPRGAILGERVAFVEKEVERCQHALEAPFEPAQYLQGGRHLHLFGERGVAAQKHHRELHREAFAAEPVDHAILSRG